MARYKVEDFSYQGRFNKYCWNPLYNPNATIENGLANCTTLAIAFSYILKNPYPVTRIVSANNWHRVLTNGWTVKPYGSVEIEEGDILEWCENCHVSTVLYINDGEPFLASSWYTGEHGVAMYEGKYDTRHFATLEQLSNFMVENYPFRMYHECSLHEEANMVGGLPEYVLKAPKRIYPVEEDRTRDQIKVLTDEQNVRDDDNNIVGIAQSGFYNVYGTKDLNGYTWYMVDKDRWIALVKGRVVFIPRSQDIDELRRENEQLKADMRKILEIVEKYASD